MMNYANVFLQFVLFVVILEYGFKKYAICKFREELFSLRNELFDLAIPNGSLRFDDKAYRDMEQLLNGTIRFAHRIKFIDFLLISIYTRKRFPEYLKDTRINFNKEIEKSLRDIKDSKTRDSIERIRDNYQFKLVKYWYARSITLIIVTIPVITFLFIKELSTAILKKTFSNREIKREVKQGMISRLKYPIFRIENEACMQGA